MKQVLVSVSLMALSATVLGLWPSSAAWGESLEPSEPSFTISSDPGVIVLSVTTLIVRGRRKHVLELRGNGDLFLRVEGLKSYEVMESYQLRLEYLEMVDLLDLVVSSGLVEATADTIEAKRCIDGCQWTISHPGRVRVVVNLATYMRDGQTRNNVNNDVGYGVAYAGIHPDVEELQGLQALYDRQRAYFDQAREMGQ